MERKDRPLGREKKVVDGTAHVGRREGAGPVPGSGNGAGAGGGSSTGGGSTRASGGQKSPLMVIILLVVALLGGGGGLSTLLGGDGSTTTSPSTDLTQVLQPFLGSGSSSTASSLPANTGRLNTTVSDKARAKYTQLKGGGKDTATIMVYMCGTDLESQGGYATTDLQEMLGADLGSNVNLLVFTGGCKRWKNNVVSTSKNQIYQVKDGGLALLAESQLQPMTDPNTLSGYIQWGKKNYPAGRYALIFWDHGGGSISGYGYDEAYPRSGSMTLDKMGQALKDGGCRFDFIGFDACLMATLETALVCEPYADYLIASEETEPGCGWYYTNWLTNLGANPSMSTLEIGKNIADDFVSTCAKVAARQQATLSLVDLAELSGTVPDSFKSFSQATAKAIKSDNYKTVANARNNTKEFARSNNIDQVDLIHLASNINTTESKALASVLRDAVKYNATSSNISNAYGMSIYFPYGKTSKVNQVTNMYDSIGVDGSYSDCIKAFASVEVAGQTVSGGQSAQLDALFNALTGTGSGSSSSSSNSAQMVSQLLGALLQSRDLPNVGLETDQAGFLDRSVVEGAQDYLTANRFDPSALVWTKKDGRQVLTLTEEQWGLVQDVELNVFVDDGEGYIDLGLDNVFAFNDDGDLLGEYDHTWLSINGQIVAYYMMDSQGTSEDYKITGYVPALLGGQRVDLMLCFTDENPDGEVLGAAVHYDAESETETVARGLLPIQDGDVIDFVCGYYDYNKVYQADYFLGDPLTVRGALEVANIRMDNTDFIAAYRFTDIYHNHYWTPTVK